MSYNDLGCPILSRWDFKKCMTLICIFQSVATNYRIKIRDSEINFDKSKYMFIIKYQHAFFYMKVYQRCIQTGKWVVNVTRSLSRGLRKTTTRHSESANSIRLTDQPSFDKLTFAFVLVLNKLYILIIARKLCLLQRKGRK